MNEWGKKEGFRKDEKKKHSGKERSIEGLRVERVHEGDSGRTVTSGSVQAGWLASGNLASR